MATPAEEKRRRRHDEIFQKDVLDGLERLRSVLHDISDQLRALAEVTTAATPAHPPSEPDQAGGKLLLSVADVAELTGLSRSAIDQLRYAQDGPVPTKIGGRLFFQRAELHDWLDRQRQVPDTASRPWRQAFLGGAIGGRHPRSSEPAKRAWCEGSHTEPMAASKYSGRAVCRVCRDDVLVNADGRLRKHHPRWW